MIANTPYGENERKGAIKCGSQALNPKANLWAKRDNKSGRDLDGKKDGICSKEIRKEKEKMEKARLKFCIERFDHYYDTINNKSSVFLGLSTFLVGGLVAAYPYIISHTNPALLINLILILVIGIGLAIMITVILASTPFQGKNLESLHFFGSISQMQKDHYCNLSTNYSELHELEDLRNQVHQLSEGLASKFKKLSLAGRLFTIQFILFAPLIALILFNLK